MKDFFNDIVEMYIGKSADPYYKNNQMTKDEYYEAINFVKKHFFLIYPRKNFNLDSIFDRAKFLVKTKGIRSLIIDPYNTVQHKMYKGEREDLYISRFMSELKRFAIENHISVNLVAHQVTPQKDDSGRYYKPDVNRIKGGGTFSDKADNVMFVWRPNRALDFSDTSVIFGSQKIKKQKLVGIPQDVEGINFNIREQRYYFDGYTPFKDIDVLRCEKKQE
jgi:twinkle protein